MPDYITPTERLSNLHSVAQQTKSFVLKSSSSDRSIIFTKWINMLIELNADPSITQAAKRIGSAIGINYKTILKYYSGGPNV